MGKKSILVFKNGSNTNGQIFVVPPTLEELMCKAYLKFNIIVRRLFIEDGTEIHNIAFVRNNDTVYISSGEDFIGPPKNLEKPSEWVTLNVGGRCFTTSRDTLTTKEPDCMLAKMFAVDKYGYLFTPSKVDQNGAFLIDRCPQYFEPIINYLRNGQLIYDRNINPEGILEEARFFGIESIIPTLEQIIIQQNVDRDNLPLTRRDVIEALITTPNNSRLRFRGVDLSKADLSHMDLRYINFKFANLQGCKLTGANLSYCCLEMADLSYANLDGAHLVAVECLSANFHRASLRNSNFIDRSRTQVNMEFANLTRANLEGSRIGCVNLRFANLKNANLRNCDLRGAILASANLEFCDLSGSDLRNANLSEAELNEANMKNVIIN